jgi:hypothetical protein
VSTQDQSAYQQSLEHQLAYWDRLRQAQPLAAGEGDVEVFPLSGRGTVYSFTTVTAPPDAFEAYAPIPWRWCSLTKVPS